jgi:hypothetical protein
MQVSNQPHAHAPDFQPSLRGRALRRLLQAYQDARELRQDTWQFALQLPHLRAEAISDTVLRRLVAEGFAAHAQEKTLPRARRRSLQVLAHLRFSERSCFVLTEAGLALARRFLSSEAEPLTAVRPSFVRCDNGHRELRLGHSIVKRFRSHADNQELVLAAFQEQDWARLINDPIPPMAGLNSKRRLRDTIARLNRQQLARLLRFHGDGSGQAVSWEVIGETANTPPTDRQHTANTPPTDRQHRNR